MHALRRFIRDQMDARGWTATDLAKASGLSKQTISVRLNDNRDRLAAPLDDVTVAGLATAFSVDPKVVLVKVGEALGLPMGETVTVYSAEGVSNEELIRVLADRLSRAGELGGDTAAKTLAGDDPANQITTSRTRSRKPARTPPGTTTQVPRPAGESAGSS